MWGRFLASLGLLILLSAGTAFAASDERVEERSVTGDVVWVGRDSMSVEFAKGKTSAEEMLLKLDPAVKVEGPKKLAQLKPGDRVSVQYRQTYREDEEKGERIFLNTVATKIVLLRSALPEGTLRSADTGVAR